jgi:hypothetical protein
MRPTRDGNLLVHRSSTNCTILVTLNGPTRRSTRPRPVSTPATPAELLDFTSAYQAACLNGVAQKCRRALTLAYRRK